jgi:hypothetical protein
MEESNFDFIIKNLGETQGYKDQPLEIFKNIIINPLNATSLAIISGQRLELP